VTTALDGAPSLWHAALFHDGDDELADVGVPFSREGLDRGEAVAVALPPRQLDALRRGLGRDAEHVLFVDVTELGRNPARVLPELAAFQRLQDERPVRALGSPVWPGRTAVELAACRQHDALLNVAFGASPMTVLCPFDRTLLDPEVIDWARATHPMVCEDGRCVDSDRYDDPSAQAAAASGPLLEPDDLGDTLVYRAPHGPRSVRVAVAEHAARHGLAEERVADLCLAVHEVAVNTVVHTSGPGLLTMWAERDAIVCQIEDSGWIRDPLVGRHPPGPADGRGYGLFLAHQLCDLVQVHSDPRDGTTVRLWMHVPAGPAEI
jgi:anti-sigma regulatory factor (Ser/Thr protein kinase)